MSEPCGEEVCANGKGRGWAEGRLGLVLAAFCLVLSVAGCGSSSTDPDDKQSLTGEGCVRCHGTLENPAPPSSVEGETDTSHVAVGAHQAHLRDGMLRARIACGECHLVPIDHDDTDHIDDLPAEITFGPLATSADAAASWDRASESCGDVYCHGGTLSGGNNTAPTWTVVDGSEAACGSCHGLPPPLPHPASDNCFKCHDETVDESGAIDVAGSKHIDGIVQAKAGSAQVLFCSTCHGSVGNPAPPKSVAGETETSAVEVGAHRSHLQDGAIRAAIPCHECHLVPASIDEPGHLDDSPAEVVFGTLATSDGLSADWDRAAETCSDVYCHGVTLEGGSNTVPSWTTVDGSEAACGSCHGLPPALPHPPSSNCRKCHDKTIDADGNIDIAGGKHIDGIVQKSLMTCSSCHGSDDSMAPPVSTTDEVAVTAIGVGAHQAHLVDGPLAKAFWCDACHVVPFGIYAPGHIDEAPAELTWGALATSDGASPSWDHDTATCSGNYCHGETLGGGSNKTPVWTHPAGEAGCGACHGLPPPPPHMAFTACYLCHGETVDQNWQINLDTHVDGILQVSFSGNCDGCHGAPPATGAHLVHFGAATTDASYGGTDVTADLLPGGNAYAFDCGNCHPVDPSHHGNGVLNSGGGAAEIDLSPVGAPPGSLKERHLPTASYQPGGTLLVDASGLPYTEGSCSDVYCHSEKTVSSSIVPEPGIDFPFAGFPIIYPAYTVDISRAYQTVSWSDSLGCDGCHGLPPRTYFPDVQAGVGDSHSWSDDWGYENLHAWNMGGTPAPCAGCHYPTVQDQGVRGWDANWFALYEPVAIVGFDQHVDGAPDVGFTPELVLVRNQPGFDLTGAVYYQDTKTCVDVPCHLQQTEVQWGAPYRWWNNYECNVCHQY